MRAPSTEESRARLRILVVEDEVKLASAVARALGGEGYQVDVAHDGTEGLRLAATGDYDLLLLDIMLPGINGFELCRRLRARAVDSPVMMLTAKAGEWDIVEALDLGADDYLVKPFSMPVLLARVRVHTRERGDTVERFEVGGLSFDRQTRRCTRDGVEVELSGREALLLETLLRHAGRPISKSQLLQEVWGDDFAGHPNVVEVYVARLRRKVDDPFRRRMIETVRGAGYRLCSPAPARRRR